MEEMLDFLEDFDSAISEAYRNGRKPELIGKKIDQDWFAKDILTLLGRVKNA